MIIGVLKEQSPETRVSLVPEVVAAIVKMKLIVQIIIMEALIKKKLVYGLITVVKILKK